jgi:hypothetical protein
MLRCWVCQNNVCAMIHPKHALTLQTQLTLPMIPFVIDTMARWFLLRHHIEWYLIPDLVTFLVTFAFFCLAVMFAINPRALPGAEELNLTVELVRQRLLANTIFAVTLAGGISFFRIMDDIFPQQHVYKDNALYVLIIVVIFVCYVVFRILTTYLSYINRNA